SSSSSSSSSSSGRSPPSEETASPASAQRERLTKDGGGDEQSARPRSPTQAETVEVIQRYCSRWIEVHKPADGRPPKLSRADKGQAVALVREHGLVIALAYVDRYLADDDAWLFEQRH